MGGTIRYALTILLAVCFFLPKPGCLLAAAFPAHLVHHFFHANVFHLALNLLAVWTAFAPGRKVSALLLPAAFAIGSISYCFALRPVIGFSNVMFAVAGLRTPSLRSAWWRSANTLVFLVTMLLMLCIPAFSATTHIAAFVCGACAASVIRRLKSLDHDTRRAAGSR